MQVLKSAQFSPGTVFPVDFFHVTVLDGNRAVFDTTFDLPTKDPDRSRAVAGLIPYLDVDTKGDFSLNSWGGILIQYQKANFYRCC